MAHGNLDIMKDIDWSILRQSYPITKDRVYLKNASISGLHEQTLAEMNHWNNHYATMAAVSEDAYFDLLQDSKDTLAHFIGCEREDVTLTENSSHNMNMLAMMLGPEKAAGKTKVLVPQDEFPSSLLPFYHHGFEVEFIPCEHGVFKLEEFEKRIDKFTAAVICSHVQFSCGFKIDPKKLGDLCRQHKVAFFLNTTQSLGTLPFSLRNTPVTALTSSCHKWLGAGIGQAILYIDPLWRKERKFPLVGWCSVDEPFAMKNENPHIRSDVSALQLGSLPFSCIAGVKKAVEITKGIGVENIQKRIGELSTLLRRGLEQKGKKPLGLLQENPSGIVTFKVEDADEFVKQLEEKKVYVNNRRGMIRVSPHFYNNEEDIETFLKHLP